MTNKLKTSRELRVEIPKELYLSGEELSGRVHFTPKRTMSIDMVKIYFAGEEFCAWSERIAMRVGAPPTNGDVKLFRKEQVLVADKTRFAPGSFTWNFRFIVPRDIPPSCIYKRGQACVAYFLKVKASTGFGRFDMVCVSPIILGQLWVPIRPIAIRSSGSHMGSSDIQVVAICSHSVAHCEEEVNCHVDINNNTRRQVEAVRVKLKQVWECGGIFHHKNTVCKVECKSGFPVFRGQHSRDIRITVPSYLIVVPTISNATLFKCSYYIGVSLVVKVGGVIEKEHAKCHIPIIISNMPIDRNAPPQLSLPPPVAPPVRAPPPSLQNYLRHSVNTLADQMVNLLTDSFSGATESSSANEAERAVTEVERIVAEINSQGDYFTSEPNEEKDNAKEDTDEPSSLSDMIDLTSGSDVPKNECIICYDGPKNMLMLPCAHIATCADCTAHIMGSNKKCPVCRCTIRQVLRTYQV